MPETEPIVSSPEKRSIVVTPLTRTNVPGLRSFSTSSSCSGIINILTEIESVKSVISNINITLPLLSSRLSAFIIWPRKIISPISPTTVSRLTASPSKSLPYITSGLSERFTERLKSEPSLLNSLLDL